MAKKEGRTFTREQQRMAVRALISDDPRERDMAQAALKLPLRSAVAQESSVRIIFNPVQLDLNEDAIFPVDDEGTVEVVVSTAYGTPPISRFVTDLVTIDTDVLQGGWETPEALIKAGRIDQVARNARRMVDGFIKKEESLGWGVIDACIGADNTVALASNATGYGTCSIELINAMFTKFQDLGYQPDICFMSPGCMGDLRLLCKDAGLPDTVKFDVWRNGMIQGLWGVDFYAMRSLADTYIYMFDTSRFGIMAIRQELETREDPSKRAQFKISYNGQEICGFAAVQKDAVVFGTTNKS